MNVDDDTLVYLVCIFTFFLKSAETRFLPFFSLLFLFLSVYQDNVSLHMIVPLLFKPVPQLLKHPIFLPTVTPSENPSVTKFSRFRPGLRCIKKLGC
jgi:hypothetical protein